jgi:hypothetical protein
MRAWIAQLRALKMTRTQREAMREAAVSEIATLLALLLYMCAIGCRRTYIAVATTSAHAPAEARPTLRQA